MTSEKWLVLNFFMGIGKFKHTFVGNEYKQIIDNLSYQNIGSPELLSEDHHFIEFHKLPNYKASLNFEYGTDLKILGYAIYYTNANDSSFDNWTFEKP
jgi:hypothetical protein